MTKVYIYDETLASKVGNELTKRQQIGAFYIF